jgi:alkyldihydroxyacetonephosphate synthase
LNGWAKRTTLGGAARFDLGPDALAFLREHIGPGAAPADATFEQACATVGPSRLAAHRLVDTGAAARVLHAHGQSLPDWLRLRYGMTGIAPDGVAWPESGAQVRVRAMAQARLPLSLLRLSNPLETQTTLALAGHKKLVAVLETYLRWRGCHAAKCMLMIGASGSRSAASAALSGALAIARGHGGIHVGRAMGDKWKRNRFRNVYLRNGAWALGYAIDTVETALDWPGVTPMMQAIEQAAADALAAHGERVHAYTHLSHVYPQGASVYSTFVYRLAGNYGDDLARWRSLKHAVSSAVVAIGGTISHQHGVGTDHAPYLEAEKGALGIGAMQALFRHFDPDGRMNPGKLVP